jgi:hypothetical protein
MAPSMYVFTTDDLRYCGASSVHPSPEWLAQRWLITPVSVGQGSIDEALCMIGTFSYLSRKAHKPALVGLFSWICF